MRIRTRIGTAAMAIALVAGIGLTSTPAQAKPSTKVSGSAKLPYLPTAIFQMSQSGVQMDATPPAISQGDGANSKTLVFPLATGPKGGALPLGGGMSIGASLARLYLVSPHLEYSAGATQGRITLVVNEMPADGPADLANGTRIVLFDVSDMTIKTTRGRVAKSGKKWTRTDTQRINGNVTIADQPTLMASINSYIGTSFFAPGLALSTLNTVITTKVTCSTRAECK